MEVVKVRTTRRKAEKWKSLQICRPKYGISSIFFPSI